MKKLLYLFIAISFIAYTSCKDDDDTPTGAGETLSQYIDASSKTTWHYFSFKNGVEVGTGEETVTDNTTWFARTDWDIAICRYYIRTNSGAATSVGSQGGVFTCDENVNFTSLEVVPDGAVVVGDKAVTITGHGGTSSEVVESTAQVIQFKLDEDGSMVMPPVYLQSPVYIFKTADGKETYKVNFTQYVNEEGTTGHVKFDYAILY
jgi:hypothetical protein